MLTKPDSLLWQRAMVIKFPEKLICTWMACCKGAQCCAEANKTSEKLQLRSLFSSRNISLHPFADSWNCEWRQHDETLRIRAWKTRQTSNISNVQWESFLMQIPVRCEQRCWRYSSTAFLSHVFSHSVFVPRCSSMLLVARYPSRFTGKEEELLQGWVSKNKIPSFEWRIHDSFSSRSRCCALCTYSEKSILRWQIHVVSMHLKWENRKMEVEYNGIV